MVCLMKNTNFPQKKQAKSDFHHSGLKGLSQTHGFEKGLNQTHGFEKGLSQTRGVPTFFFSTNEKHIF